MFVLDVIKFEDNVKSSLAMLQVFIIVVGIVAFIVTFFLLIVSTAANIRENMWEFGVLRAIGLKKGQIIRVYLYESLAVTISSCILGLIVGFMIAFTLSLQFNLFLELPFFISFPYTMVIVMLILAMLTTVIGTVYPLNEITNRPIAGILKGAA